MKYLMMTILLILVINLAAFADTVVCVVGDTGTGTKEQYLVADAMERAGCQRILVTGDTIYPNGAFSSEDRQWASKFEQPYKNLLAKNALFYITLGNHDHRSGRASRVEQVYSEYSKMNPGFYFPSRYYAFHSTDSWSGSACFWAIDSEEFDDEQAQSVELSMQSNSNCRWKVVFGHHPIVSSGLHGDASWRLASKLQPILERNADIYFAGHDHNLSDEGNVSSNGKEGFRQIVSGAGAKLRAVYPCAMTGCKFVSSTLGFVKANFSANNVKLDFINTDNEVIYSTILD